MKIKASELSGVALDWAVSKCLNQGEFWTTDEYSKSWHLAGPIIEQERFAVWFEKHDDVDCGLPIWFAQDGYAPPMQGSTPLIAAMRCYVAGMLGDEIEVPDCLI